MLSNSQRASKLLHMQRILSTAPQTVPIAVMPIVNLYHTYCPVTNGQYDNTCCIPMRYFEFRTLDAPTLISSGELLFTSHTDYLYNSDESKADSLFCPAHTESTRIINNTPIKLPSISYSAVYPIVPEPNCRRWQVILK